MPSEDGYSYYNDPRPRRPFKENPKQNSSEAIEDASIDNADANSMDGDRDEGTGVG